MPNTIRPRGCRDIRICSAYRFMALVLSSQAKKVHSQHMMNCRIVESVGVGITYFKKGDRVNPLLTG